jgi:ATP-dependent RNA helicase RhlE
MLFQDLNLIEPILRALKTEGYTTPTPIQEQAIPILLQHKDLLGCAQTGTGKTAAFAIPILQLLYQDRLQHKEQKTIKALILTPTRELAIQIDESFAAYGKHTGLKHLVIFGGVNQNPQTDALRRGVDILVATPGRLLDLMNQRYVNLEHIKMLVLDEADRMLDMGFVHDVKKIIAKVPAKRQTLFFSATMPKEIQQLADTILNKPEKVEVTPVSSTADTIQQALYYVEKNDKRALLAHILKDKEIKTALVFTRTKHGADKVVKDLIRVGITAEAIHGNKSQNARQRALTNFKNRTTRVLIATDIAARGIDIDELTHVINYELPNIPETYVHRIGRTGRAGASGIHKLISKEIPVEEAHPYPMSPQSIVAKHAEGKKKGGGGQGGGGQKRGRAFGRADRGRGASGKTPAGSGMSGASRGGNRDRGGRRD